MIDEDKLKEFGRILKQNYSKLRPWAGKNNIECYRIYNRNVSGIDFTIDIYKDNLHASCFESKTELTDTDIENILTLAGRVLYIDNKNIYYKYREKLTDHSQYGKFASEHKELIINENGLSFQVNLSDYIDTGLFLDHRSTRMMIRENSCDAEVLNLFAYTGSFSVYAAAGYAARTTTVDMSRTYLDWAERNMALNNFTGKNHCFVHTDALSFIDESLKTGREKWDIIILDPPTFSNSRKMSGSFDIQKDHVKLIKNCTRLLKPRGRLLFSTNYRKFNLNRGELKDFILREITNETIPNDFLGSKIHRCWIISERHERKRTR